MRILLLNQAFYPDVVATAQYATDLALSLQNAGHEVSVIASRFGYDDPNCEFKSDEQWRGINICRISVLRLGKSSRWRRAFVFGSFIAACMARAICMPKFDVVIALTSPPLISAIGAALVSLKGGKFVFWVMDLNPDEAIAANWIRNDSLTARFLHGILQFSLNRSDRVIALDKFMAQRLVAKGITQWKIAVIPPWSHDAEVRYDVLGRARFRREHGLEGKFVVMYSGNHSPCHPLDTLMQAANRLRNRTDIVFCFVGGGSEQGKIRRIGEAKGLHNIKCLPYQPTESLSASLSAADLHVVVMGDPFVGIIHPCKVYNIRRLGTAFIYIGLAESHISELSPIASFRHAEVDGVEQFISSAAGRDRSEHFIPQPIPEASRHSQRVLLPEMLQVITGVYGQLQTDSCSHLAEC